MNDLRNQLRSFLVGHFLFGEDNGMADTASLLEIGVLDSTGVLELVSHLEETYGFKVGDDELIPENLDSVESLVAFVEAKTAGASAAAAS